VLVLDKLNPLEHLVHVDKSVHSSQPFEHSEHAVPSKYLLPVHLTHKPVVESLYLLDSSHVSQEVPFLHVKQPSVQFSHISPLKY